MFERVLQPIIDRVIQPELSLRPSRPRPTSPYPRPSHPVPGQPRPTW